jgi:hypothetical protein
LPALSARKPKLRLRVGRRRVIHRSHVVDEEDLTGQPALPCEHSREPQSADGAASTRHLQHVVCVLHWEHGRPHEGCEGGWEVGKREPNETLTPLWGVGWGRVVGARESRAHQDEDGRRRPLASEKTGPKVLCGRESCTRGISGSKRNGKERFKSLAWRMERRCCAGCLERGTSGAKRGV